MDFYLVPKRRLSKCFLIFLTFFIIPVTFAAQNNLPPWPQWLAELRSDAVAQGIDPNLFDQVFAGVYPNPRVLHLDKTQPEHRLTLSRYRQTRVDNYKIQLGRREFQRYQSLLNQIGEEYQVSPCFITALWGMESSYGRYMGNFPVIKSLATLAYDGRRGSFFRQELLYALQILNGGHVSPEDFKGEWAGASGHPQFLPSSWMKYAVDYDQDGHRDIWHSHSDVFASIANYLKINGWQSGQPWGTPVNISENISSDMVGVKITKPLAEWQQLGVVPRGGNHFPDAPGLMASLIRPEGGPDFLIYNNFKTILRYNNSIYYGATVGYLADQICRKQVAMEGDE